jgi:hypothetical protein
LIHVRSNVVFRRNQESHHVPYGYYPSYPPPLAGTYQTQPGVAGAPDGASGVAASSYQQQPTQQYDSSNANGQQQYAVAAPPPVAYAPYPAYYPSYPVYAPYPAYYGGYGYPGYGYAPNVSIGLGFGWGGGWGGGYHGGGGHGWHGH